MITRMHFVNDVKQIIRDPIMSLMIFAPLLMTLVVKLMVIFLVPFIVTKTGFDVSFYYRYVLATTLVMNASIMGIVIGFMMIDERDGNITQLMAVTPLGRSGYLANRLFLISLLTAAYNALSYFVLGIVELPFLVVAHLTVLSAIYAATIGILLYLGASDKVKGLTYAKGLNILMLFIFTDLFALNWLTVISWAFPTYWISIIIKSPYSLLENGITLFVHIAWLLILIHHFWRRES